MTPRSLAVAVILLAAASTADATDLVNINTADLTTLETLSGIGPSKAQAIIDYRTQHGAFTSTDQIMNVSGIGTATYAKIQPFITVGDTAAAAPAPAQQAAADASASSSPTQTVQTLGGVGPPPVTARITTDATAVVGAGTLFVGAAFGTQGQPLTAVRYIWNFGDGATAEGQQAWHTYAYPGTYDVELSVANGFSSGTARAAVEAAPASVALVAEGDGSLTVGNRSDYDLDIGGWSLVQGTSTFRIPDRTMLLRGKGVRFAPMVLKFIGDETAALYYPNGARAADAAVGAQSPLRGQVVDTAPAKQTSAGYAVSPAGKTAEVGSPSLAKPPAKVSSPPLAKRDLAAAAAGANEVEWSYYLGLAAVIAIGTVGSYYAYIPARRPEETPDLADEFDIQ